MKTTINFLKANKFQNTLMILLTVFLSGQFTYSQSGSVPEELKLKLYNAKNNGNTVLAKQINNEIESHLDKTTPEFGMPQNYFEIEPGSSGETDWYNNDILVLNKNIGDKGYKQIDIKQGPDGNLYAAAITKETGGPVSGITCLKSTNGGINWETIGSIGTTDRIFSLSMLVESRNDNNPDSTRFWIYFTASTSENGDNAPLRVFSRRSDGSSTIFFTVAQPAGGNKYEFVSACSDGQFWSEVTYMHIVVRELSNANTFIGLRHFRTANWGASFTNAQINTGSNDDYPSAVFFRGGNDSIFIAVERKISGTESQIKVLSTHNIPNGNFVTRSLGVSGPNIKFEKPVMSCTQRNANNINRFMVTCTKNGFPMWITSTNSGLTWSPELMISSAIKAKYTFCASDSTGADGNYFVITSLSEGGDSLRVYQGDGVSMGLLSTKVNTQFSTNLISPACVVYKKAGVKNAGVLFSGISRANMFFNGSHLITGIQNVGITTPDGFKLSQNYPNPFNPVTNIEFSVPKSAYVKLTVYDITGRQLNELVNSQMSTGSYKIDFDASQLSSGIYFYTLETDGFSQTKKMMLIK